VQSRAACPVFQLPRSGFVVFEKSAEVFKPVQEYELADSPTWTYPVVFGKNLLIKDAAKLTLWSVD